MTKSIEKQQAATAAATIAQRVGSDTSAAAAVPLNAFCKFANATAAAVAHAAAARTAVPSHWLCSAKESESESESPLRMAGDVGGGRVRRRGACSGSHVGSVRKSRGTHRHPRHPTVVAL